MTDVDASPKEPGSPADDRWAAGLRGFGPRGILAILVILTAQLLAAPLGALLVLAWARMSHTPWPDIGFARPRSWIAVLALGVVFGVALKLLMKAVVMPLLGADPINHAFHHLVGNTTALPGILVQVVVVAGFGEETLFRGYLFERLGKLLGRSAAATIATVLLTSAIFGVLHYPEQGLAGAQQATIVGLIIGAIYAGTRRLWFPMFAHAAFDVAAVAIIYWNLESAIAHAVFR